MSAERIGTGEALSFVIKKQKAKCAKFPGSLLAYFLFNCHDKSFFLAGQLVGQKNMPANHVKVANELRCAFAAFFRVTGWDSVSSREFAG